MSHEFEIDLKERLAIEPITIGIIGSIGVGKSTLAHAMSETLGIAHIEEKFTENPFLNDFYNDPNRWSFDSEFKALLDKSYQLKNLDKTKSAFIDPDLEMDFVYALTHKKMGWMDPRELELYKETRSILQEVYEIKKPDIIFRLYAPLPVILDRIKKRGREMEKGLLVPPHTYLAVLENAIEEYVAKDNSGKIIHVDAAEDNFINEVYINGLIEKVKRKI